MLLEFSECETVELRVKKEDRFFHCMGRNGSPLSSSVELTSWKNDIEREFFSCPYDQRLFKQMCRNLDGPHSAGASLLFSKRGSCWTRLQRQPTPGSPVTANEDRSDQPDHFSRAVIPLTVGTEIVGLLQLKRNQEKLFCENDIELYEDLAETLGVALVNQLNHLALRERVKELTCLYSVAQLVERPSITLDQILQGIVELLPPAWQYPEIAVGRITLDGNTFATADSREGSWSQSAQILVSGQHRGVIEVAYLEDRPEMDEGPFLKEERNLIDALAQQISLIIQRRQAEEDKLRLQDQLRHADRLATIGQLAAGVAHELNEPLGNILGFAQLVKKCEGLPSLALEDVGKIEAASLHAREVIKKLLIFARQMPPQKTQVNLNEVVEEGLYFLESRCAKSGIELVCTLSPSPPQVTADPAQLNQVLVNLVVNAIQAMPDGGRLTVRTSVGEHYASLVTEDTGIGMSDEVKEQVFIPFFTTKDVGEGTGLGLAVVHGILTSHGGSVRVDSEVGRGSRFEIRLPLARSQDEPECE